MKAYDYYSKKYNCSKKYISNLNNKVLNFMLNIMLNDSMHAWL